jgi:iron-sulfur cluster assembly protein
MVSEAGSVQVTLSDLAEEKLVAMLEQRGIAGAALRVWVAGGGCSGYQYGMTIAEEREADDLVIPLDRVTLLVDPQSAPMLDGAEIDFVDGLMRAGFTISNPNAVSTCACGSSFQTAQGDGSPKRCC